jgi:uncharacterized protein YlzI (FlbEa/FlbD family)
MTYLNISAKNGTQHFIFIDKICNISQVLGDNTTTISLVNGVSIITNHSFTELIQMLKLP